MLQPLKIRVVKDRRFDRHATASVLQHLLNFLFQIRRAGLDVPKLAIADSPHRRGGFVNVRSALAGCPYKASPTSAQSYWRLFAVRKA
jgi:hypothetical protein